MTKWEYLYAQAKSGGQMSLKELNEFGDKGWEVVSVVKLGNIYDYLFKRPCGQISTEEDF